VATPLDEDLRALLECGVATVIGTHDAALAPEIARGWGVHVVDGRTVEVCVGLPSARRTLANLAENAQIAMTCVRPSDYRQVQLKGRVVATLEPTDEDRARVGRHREAFREEVAHVGIAAHLVDGFWNHDPVDAMVKIRFAVGDAYEQTPGPDAGRPL
jgi:Pyridoxamine 5'-phosphate oxidase